MPVDPHHPHEQLESPNVAARAVVWIGIGLLVLLGASVAGLTAIYDWYGSDRSLALPQQFPAPRVVLDERAAREQLQTEQRERLSGYRWANPEKTAITIPIERAMEIVAKRGTDAYAPIAEPGEATPAPGPAAAAANQDHSRETRPPGPQSRRQDVMPPRSEGEP